MTHYMIGKVLQERYQILQHLGAGVFGQTYIAVDIDTPGNPKCVVKQLKASSVQSSYLQNLRLRFLCETETLKYLGHHEQIPQLLACFEENERFYLVQEFIEGHGLAVELPINQCLDYLWTEKDVLEFLQDILHILQFIHQEGVIHCDVKPENLIRRHCDGKLFLIDFGSIQPVDFGVDAVFPIHRIPVTSLGYIPPEQFIGQTQPNSDIYSLGMIAIQALTGLSPLQLKVDPLSNEIIWRSQLTPVNDYLASVLSKMIRHDYKQRFQSAKEVLQILKQIPLIDKESQTLEAEYTISTELIEKSSFEPISPLVMGMKLGLAANSLVIGFGVYSLLSNSSTQSGTNTLSQAKKDYQAGDFKEAISLAKSIPTNSNVYPEAQATIEEWENQWQLAAEKYNTVEKAAAQEQWSDALRAAFLVPNIPYWQSKTNKIVEQAKSHIEVKSHDLLSKAYEKAIARDFSNALFYLRQIPKEFSASKIVQKKLVEYDRKQRIRAAYLLKEAEKIAEVGDFDGAVKLLRKVPKDTPVYGSAQVHLIEYTRQQDLQIGKTQQTTPLKTASANSFINSKLATKLQNFQPENYMQEVNIK